MARIATALLLLACALAARAAAQTAAPRLAHPIAAPGGAVQRAPLPDTVRILAVMAEFQPDDDARTSGTGRFNTVFPYDYGADIIDAYPHDRAYFQAHLRFLENYIEKASGARTHARAAILDTVVTLPKNIRSYSFRKGESEKPVAELAVDAWTAADRARPGTDFSAYDMFIVFHAGRGRDVDLASIQGSDPTPFDIPSLSFTLNAFRRHFGPDYAGIPVNGGAHVLQNCSILPSTDSREIPLLTGQTALLELSINGLLAASFGTYAGLPDLFNTTNGRTGIGRFGLMDAESIFAFGGICPPAPSAWEKAYLGWTTPRSAEPGTREYLLSAYRTDQPSTADVLRVPIAGGEYWLLENRQRDPGNNGQRVTYLSGGQEVSVTFPKDTSGFSNDNISALKGVVVDVEDLDWSLPGGIVSDGTREARVNGGLLIWHVDEDVIAAGLAGNTVNTDAKQRGVDLEQAGGPQDIGETIQSVLGSSIGTGGPLDYWHRDNLSPVYVNSFGPGTRPDARANDGSFPHVTIDNFGVSGPLMSFTVALGDAQLSPMAGWPVDVRETGDGRRAAFVRTADIDNDGAYEVVVASHVDDSTASETATIHVFEQDGTNYRGGGTRPRVAARLTRIARVLEAPAIGDANGDGVPDIVVHASADHAGRDKALVVVSTRDLNNDGALDEVARYYYVTDPSYRETRLSGWMVRDGSLWFRVTHDPQMISSFLPPDTLFVRGALTRAYAYGDGAVMGGGLAATDDAALFFDGRYRSVSDGSPVAQQSTSLYAARADAACVVADVDGNGTADAADAAMDLRIVTRAAGTVPAWRDKTPPAALPSDLRSLAAADIDGDGRHDIMLTASSAVAALNASLSHLDRYPVPESDAAYTLAARLEGDTRDALFVVGARRLTQLDTRATPADGFPVPLPAHHSVELMPVGATQPTLGIAVGAQDGLVYLYSTSSRLAQNGLVWRTPRADAGRTSLAAAPASQKTTRSEFFPAERCYNWPNPVYDPVTKIRFYVSENADVTVAVYDLAGAKVAEFSAKALGGVDNEIDWNVTGVQTGVYLAHVKAEGAGNSGAKIIKIAVVK